MDSITHLRHLSAEAQKQPGQTRSTTFAEVILEVPPGQSGKSLGLSVTLSDGTRIDIACRTSVTSLSN